MKLPFKLQSKERKKAERIEAKEYLDFLRNKYGGFDPIKKSIEEALPHLETENPRTIIRKLEDYIQEEAAFARTLINNSGWACFSHVPIDPFNPAYKLNLWDKVVVTAKTIGGIAIMLGLGYGLIKGMSCVNETLGISKSKTNYSLQENLENRLEE